MCHNGYNHQSWVSSSFSYTAYSCWILFNATALSTEVHGLWYCWWALNLLRWAAFYGYLGMLKSNKWQTGGAIRKAHMFLINQQIDACLEGSLTPARVACQELLFNIFFFFNTWSKKVHPSKLCLLSRIGSFYNMQCFLDISSNFFCRFILNMSRWSSWPSVAISPDFLGLLHLLMRRRLWQ